ncbi:MAG: ferredoxin, partial [Eubacterium sp.]
NACRPQPETIPSKLNQWPVQIKLVPTNAPYFENADLLIAADCTAYAYGDFHNTFIKNRITLIGCPKLDAIDYADKLTAILKNNTIRSIKIVRMSVPCCGGLVKAVQTALQKSGKMIPWSIDTVGTDGTLEKSL